MTRSAPSFFLFVKSSPSLREIQVNAVRENYLLPVNLTIFNSPSSIHTTHQLPAPGYPGSAIPQSSNDGLILDTQAHSIVDGALLQKT